MSFFATLRTRIADGIGVSASKGLKEKLRSHAENGAVSYTHLTLPTSDLV